MSSYQVDRDKWRKLNIFEQMGNIYSEVGRTFEAAKSDQSKSQAALTRAIDLLDATAEVHCSLGSPKVGEVLRAKEEFVNAYFNPKLQKSIENYFRNFALAARLQK